jgi:drug/metabolite transporter (DMT)-like permease
MHRLASAARQVEPEAIDGAGRAPYSLRIRVTQLEPALTETAEMRPAPPAGLARWGLQILLVVLAVAWGATVSLTTVFMESGIDPLVATFWSSVVGVVLLSLYLGVRGLRPPMSPRHLLLYVTCGFLGTALPSVLAFASAEHLSAGVRSILFALIPMMTLAMAAALGRERTGPMRLLGLVLGAASVLVLLQPGDETVTPAQYIWIVASIGTVTCYALENIVIDTLRPEGLDSFVALWGMMLMACLMTFPVLLWRDVPLLPPFGLDRYGSSFVLMSCLNVLCYGGYIVLIGRAGPVFASQTSYLTPPTGILWGVIILSETVTATIVASVVLVLIGIALVRPREGHRG